MHSLLRSSEQDHVNHRGNVRKQNCFNSSEKFLDKISIIEVLCEEEKTFNSSQNYLADLVPTFYWTQT